jgi:uncharacterized coiled-coil DUF342 family protein
MQKIEEIKTAYKKIVELQKKIDEARKELREYCEGVSTYFEIRDEEGEKITTSSDILAELKDRVFEGVINESL